MNEEIYIRKIKGKLEVDLDGLVDEVASAAGTLGGNIRDAVACCVVSVRDNVVMMRVDSLTSWWRPAYGRAAPRPRPF